MVGHNIAINGPGSVVVPVAVIILSGNTLRVRAMWVHPIAWAFLTATRLAWVRAVMHLLAQNIVQQGALPLICWLHPDAWGVGVDSIGMLWLEVSWNAS
jgi:hypothetical protein